MELMQCSNRSAALLKLNKMQKALADAEECIQIKSSWDKGHFRKANILEATKQYEQAGSEAANDACTRQSVVSNLMKLLRMSRDDFLLDKKRTLCLRQMSH